mmetsp:Transcript_28880/g.66307  ORF Transcript_28880/g.66307 Transcript_28880/m.66307 type:complete len:322 (+) Transcript_28880:2934-3899(+)
MLNPVRVAHAEHTHGLQHTGAPQLTHHRVRVPRPRRLRGVRLDAADEVHVARIEQMHQFRQLLPKFGDHPLELASAFCCDDCAGKHCAHKSVLRALHQHQHVLRHRILVLAEHARTRVGNRASVVDHREAIFLLDHLFESARAHVLLDHLLVQGGVRALGNDAFLVDHCKEASRVPLHQYQHLLVVEVAHVCVVNLHPLRRVLLSRRGEDGFVEAVLQFLVRKVDAQLFQRVELKMFEAENIEDSDEEGRASSLLSLLSHRERSVHAADGPIKQFGVKCFHHTLDYVSGLLDVAGRRDKLSSRANLSLGQRECELSLVDLQ